MSKRFAFTVHGRVQGVCFRNFTEEKASSYGLTGFVKNTTDGKVRGEAQGDEASLKKLKSDLKEGPRAAHVVKLEFNEIQVKTDESSFTAS